MTVLWAVLGALLLIALGVDVVLTTLGAGVRTGPLTGRLARAWWRAVFLRHWRRRGTGTLVQYGGPATLVLVLLTWVLVLWAGWTAVFLAGAPAVQHAATGAPAGLGEVIYFAGFAVFTLGLGDYAATTDLWRILTDVAAFSGLFLMTLSITYLLNVLSAVVQRRALAQQIHALGTDPTALLRSGWTGREFTTTFLLQLNSLTAALSQVGEQQLAYPVVSYFRGNRRHASLPVAAAVLYDAMLLLQEAVADDARPADVPDSLRTLIAQLLNTSALDHVGAPAEAPPPPDLAPLREVGMPLRPGPETRQALADAAETRQQLRALVEGSGWAR